MASDAHARLALQEREAQHAGENQAEGDEQHARDDPKRSVVHEEELADPAGAEAQRHEDERHAEHERGPVGDAVRGGAGAGTVGAFGHGTQSTPKALASSAASTAASSSPT